MSKIAEKKALEAYPIKITRFETGTSIGEKYDTNYINRQIYIQGYDQAIQDFLEKACEWLESNLIDKEIVFMGIWHKFTDKDIEQFKNYMQHESKN